MRFAVASVVLLFTWANPAAADLYRWVDPETGSVKFSSYPPPWYGDAAKARRAPKVEVIPSVRTTSAAEAKGAAKAVDGPDRAPKPPPAPVPSERRQ